MSLLRRITSRIPSQTLRQCREASQTAKNKPQRKDAIPTAAKAKSALYVVTRSGQGGVLALVQPALDFDDRLQDTDKLKQELHSRNVEIDVETLKDGWRRLKDLKENIKVLEEEREKVKEKVTSLKNDPNSNEEVKVLIDKGKSIRQEIKKLKEELCDIEEDIVVPAFKTVPNFLHKHTPIGQEQIIYEAGKKREFSFTPQSHVEIGKKHGDIILSDASPGAYYLQGKAALYELEIQQFFSDALLEAEFTPFSNPDFSKPLIVEACIADPLTSTDVLSVQSKDQSTAKELFTGLYLTGSASLAAFCAYHTRAVVSSPCVWPLRYFAVGRHYGSLDIRNDTSRNLLSAVQSSRVHMFVATANTDELGSAAYRSTLQLMIELYSQLGLHFRVVNVPVEQLQKMEMLRTSLQMWLPFSQKYVEIGYIAVCGDYVSRRLLCQYQDGGDTNYLYMIHGVAVDVPRILACVVENGQTEQGTWEVPEFEVVSLFKKEIVA